MAECREPDLDKQRISLRKDGCPQDQVHIPSYDTLCQKGTGQVPALGEANGGRVRVSGTGCVLGECQSPGHPGHPHWHLPVHSPTETTIVTRNTAICGCISITEKRWHKAPHYP